MSDNSRMFVITKNFGLNFTGATVATHETLKRIEKDQGKVIVFAKNIGEHELENTEFIQHNNLLELIHHIKSYKKTQQQITGFSDDHFGFIFKIFNIKYYHVYHGNWPDAQKVDLTSFLKSFYFIPLYLITLKFANKVINVSYYMDSFVRKINSSTLVIRNGLKIDVNTNNLKNEVDTVIRAGEKIRILMTGNIDKRKYKMLPSLLNLLNEHRNNFEFHIYGTVKDEKLSNKILQYSNVTLMGYVPHVEYGEYDLFLTTSKIENLSIAVCEAISSKIPVISFNTGGLNEIIEDGENGFTIRKYDINEMAYKLIFIQKNGYTFTFNSNVIKSFDWDVSAKKYLKVLK